MIPIEKFSPSSLEKFDECEMKWFLSYVLYYREPSGRAAIIGTCSHYILELFAKIKISQQNNVEFFEDPIVGNVYSEDENKWATWIDPVFDHFTKKEGSHIAWEKKDKKEFVSNINTAIAHELSPLKNKTIICPEKKFFVEIDEPWAEYTFMKDGAIKQGKIGVNGVIDLVYQDNNGMNYIDYKFGGSLKDWVTGQEKDYEYFYKNTQLCMYYWALKKLFPEYNDITTRIWYVKLEKPFELYFGDEQIQNALSKVKTVFNRIKSMSRPKRSITYKCKFCPFSKTNFSTYNNSKLDLIPSSDDKFAAVDSQKSICDATNYFFDHRSMELIMENCKNAKQ